MRLIEQAVWKSQTYAEGRFDEMNKIDGNAAKIQADLEFLQNAIVEDKAKVVALSKATTDYVTTAKSIRNAYERNDAVLKKCAEVAVPLMAKVDECCTVAIKRIDEASVDGVKALGSSVLTVVVGLLAALVAGVFISLFLSGSITRPVKAVAVCMERLARGDLTAHVDVRSKDEVGAMAAAMNKTIADLREIMADIRAAADQAAASSEELSATAQNISSGSQQQASAVEEISASVETLTAAIQNVAGNAKDANAVADDTKQAASQGTQIVSSSIEGMKLINESSEKMSKIIGAISQIASQTNLLALNAAIEAASAGEHGLGFAVVADEVRKLAERSSHATEEITQLIKESTTRVNDGSRLSDQVGKSLADILGGIDKTGTAMASIRSATSEQAATASEVSKGMENISAVTEENSASAEEMSASAEELAAQAQKLQELVSKFTLEGATHAEEVRATVTQPVRGTNKVARPARQAIAATKGHGTPAAPALPRGEIRTTLAGALYHD